MTTVTLDIPTSPREHDIAEAARVFVSFAHHHPEELEDVLMGIRMKEADNEETISLEHFLISAGISK